MSECFEVGQRVRGTRLVDFINEDGYQDMKEVSVEGAFMFRTDDPEEYIQDVVIKTDDGEVVYIDEQDARSV